MVENDPTKPISYTTAEEIRRDAAERRARLGDRPEPRRDERSMAALYLRFVEALDRWPALDSTLLSLSGAPLNEARTVRIRELRLQTVHDYVTVFEQRASGTCAALFMFRDSEFRNASKEARAKPHPSRVFAVFSEDSWFRELLPFEREYVVFRLFFTPRLPGFSDDTVGRLWLAAATRRLDHEQFDDDDDRVAGSFRFLSDFAEWLGMPLGALRSLADLDPVYFRMASHHLRVAEDFKKELSRNWTTARLEKGIASLECCGPVGASAASCAQSERETHVAFVAGLESETVGFHRDIAAQACQRLASQHFAQALERHRTRPAPALTLRGLQRALFVGLAVDLIGAGVSESEATRRTNAFLSHILGPPYGGDIPRFARQSVRRWVRKLAADSPPAAQ